MGMRARALTEYEKRKREKERDGKRRRGEIVPRHSPFQEQHLEKENKPISGHGKIQHEKIRESKRLVSEE